jgi:hypothetical protein
MNFDAWVAAKRPQDLGAAEREIVEAIGEALRDPMAPAPLEPDDAFDALRRDARRRFRYTTAPQLGIVNCLRNNTLNCGAASDLVVGVLLYLSGKDLQVQRFCKVFGGAIGAMPPVVTPPVEHPGVTITPNIDGGGGRMLFSGGHVIAVVDGNQYDLIGGNRGHHLDFTRAYNRNDGTGTFDGNIDGVDYTFTKVDGTTPEGLATYRVDPQIA